MSDRWPVASPSTLLLALRSSADDPRTLRVQARWGTPDDLGPRIWRGAHRIDPPAVAREWRALRAAQARTIVGGEAGQAARSAGQLLFDLLLPAPVKQAIRGLSGGALLIERGPLLDGPWPLLDDGRGPLGLRLGLGEVSPTDRWPPDTPDPGERLSILADPAGDLPAARAEGEALAAVFAEAARAPVYDLRLGLTGRAEVLRALRRYGVLHLAGHVDPDDGQPGGWRLADGRLTPAEIEPLRGGAVPRLIFANACRSTGPVGAALLDAGVRHLVGTDLDLPDLPGADFAAAFYRALLTGAPIGEALRRARVAAADRGDPVWMAYRLHGDPATPYAAPTAEAPPAELRRAIVLAVRRSPRGDLEPRAEATRAWHRRFAELTAAAGGQALPPTGALCRAVFGVPARREDDARRAAEAALALAAEDPAVVAALDGGRLAIAGDDVLGAPLDRAEMTSWRAAPGVHIPPAVARSLHGIARFADGQPHGRLIGLDRPPAPAGPFVGRRTELDRIEALAPGEALTALGPAGIGKSRLLAAARLRLQSRFVVRVVPADGEGPYGGLAGLVRRLCGLDRGVGDVRGAIDRALAPPPRPEAFLDIDALLSGPDALLDGPDPRDHGDTLAAMLGLESPAEPAEAGADARVAAALRALLEAADPPVAVIVEDAHRSPAIGVLEALIADPPAGALLLVTARPGLADRRPGWFQSPRHHRLDLGPLPDRAARALAAILRPEADEASLGALLTRAEGNPLFVHELARIEADEPGREALPDSIEAVMQARLDRLDASDRQVLRAAAVLGRVFWAEGVERLLGRTDLEPTLDRLASDRFVLRDPESAVPGAAQWRFAHGLLHAVVEQSLPGHARAALHGRAALWLADEVRGDPTPRRARIAAHRAASGDHRRARADWLAAADHAEASLATDAARHALRAALGLLDGSDEAEAGHLEARLGELDRVAGDLETAAARFTRALAASPPDDHPARALRHSRISRVELARGRTAEARSHSEQALVESSAIEAADPDLRAEVEHQAAWLDYHAGALDRAEARLNRLAEALPARARRARGIGWHLLGIIAQQRGHADRASAWFRRALAMLGRDDPERARVVHGLALVAVQRGDYEAAAEHYAEGIRMRARRGDLAGLAKTYSNLGTLYGERGGPGDYPRAARYLEEAIRIRARIGHAALAISRANLGDLYLRWGRIAEARAELEQAAVADPPSWARSELWRMTADLRLRQGDLDAAADGAARAIDAARALADRVREAAALELAATIAEARGRRDEARQALAAAVELHRIREAPAPLAAALDRLAGHLDPSDPIGAGALRAEARALRAAIGPD